MILEMVIALYYIYCKFHHAITYSEAGRKYSKTICFQTRENLKHQTQTQQTQTHQTQTQTQQTQTQTQTQSKRAEGDAKPLHLVGQPSKTNLVCGCPRQHKQVRYEFGLS
ncbi:MAG: hypothetical protein ACKPKO_23805, partial [Candidatus Fonsibacter sp.]